MTDSFVQTSAGGTSFVGPDAVSLFTATALISGLRMYARSGMRPNRAWTPTAMLAKAGAICGKSYKRGQYAQAIADLETWRDTMRAAIPVIDSEGNPKP